MLATYTREQTEAGDFGGMSDALEQGRIVYFPVCPIPLPAESELEFLREELPRHLKRKNVSYHPEADRVIGIDGDRDLVERVRRILVERSRQVEEFLAKAIPSLAENWTVGTSSLRPLQEQGRGLKAHASNELIHLDAGAYGATNGDHIFRFFVNLNPEEDRVWATKGAFPELFERYGKAAGVAPDNPPPGYLTKRPLDHVRTAMINGLCSLGLPVKVLDSSPYDRAMRRFHNFMKDSPEFQRDPEGHQEFRFKPFSAWMVFTDVVSHACLSGQHAFVNTFLIRLQSCRLPELAPINILRRSRS